ncbi:MAG: FxLYD domain-containing protein [Verrucomicrobia bacterium]|nr:FxLYD domain-containing protein [Verrucomicrobiota bacterium]
MPRRGPAMIKIKNLSGACQHCGRAIEFRAETAGMTADCPHCGQPTELLLALPPDSNTPARTKAILFTIVALVILIGGLIGTVLALKRAERLSARHRESAAKANAQIVPPPANPFAPVGFSVSPVTLEQSQSSAIVHAVGKVRNLTNRQRFGVRVQLELLDRNGRKIGEAKDYQALLEPNAEWPFRALVVEPKAVSAIIRGITED